MFTVRSGHPAEDAVRSHGVGGATARLRRPPAAAHPVGGRVKRRSQYPDAPGGWGDPVPRAQSGQRLERELQ